MALTVRRFLAIVLVGMTAIMVITSGIVAVFYHPYEPSNLPPLREARAQISRLDGAISSLERRDSIASTLRAHPPAPGLTIVLPAGGPQVMRDSAARLIREKWNLVAGDAAAYPVVILVRSDLGRARAGAYRSAEMHDVTLVPNPPTLNACVIDLFAPRDVVGGRSGSFVGFSRLERLPQRLAPCAIVARYGSPGPGPMAWLNGGTWWQASLPVPVTEVTAPRSALRGAVSQPRSTAMFLVKAEVSPYSPGSPELRWRGLGVDGTACLAGRREACQSMLLADAGDASSMRSSFLLPSGMLRRNPYEFASWSRMLVFNIERSLGPEKFAEFWKSAEHPEVALAKLVPGGAAAVVRERLEELALPLSSSPWPTPVEWLAHLALIASAVGLMSFGARARAMKV